MHSILLSMGMTKFCLTDSKENTTVWKVLSNCWDKITKGKYNQKQTIDFSEVTLQYQMNLSLTAGFALNLSKMTRKIFGTL